MFAGFPAQRTYAPLHFRNVRFIPPPASPDEPPRFSLLADVRLHAVALTFKPAPGSGLQLVPPLLPPPALAR